MFGQSGKVENQFQFQQKQEQNQNERKKNYDGSLQNGEMTLFYFKKLKQLEISLSLIILIGLYLIIVATNQSFPQITQKNLSTIQLCHYFGIACNIVASILMMMRTLTVIQLEKQQKQIYQKANIFSTKKILSLFVQWFILCLQPYPFFININFTTYNTYKDQQIQYPFNDLLAILSFGRIYQILRTCLVLTPYMNNRANRLCKMYGCRADFSYSLKCMFKQHPLWLITVFFSIIASQRPISIYGSTANDINKPPTNFSNALWLVLITTTTVGYGDYVPQTPLGRIIILFVAILGTLIVSIMVVVVGNTLNMQKSEIKTSKIINKLLNKEQLQQRAQKLIGYFMLFHLKKNKNKSVYYENQLHKAKKLFGQTRKVIKQLTQDDDLEDQIASHFLKINDDIDILNANQDKIIDYIHENFNAKTNIIQQSHYDKGQQSQQSKDFIDLFKTQIKLKTN